MFRRKLKISGADVWPIIEGGKGVSVSDGGSSGSFAAADAVGTISAVNARVLDGSGNVLPLIYKGRTRLQKHNELMEYSIKGAISQIEKAVDIAKGRGRIHINVLWEMAGVSRVLHGVLSQMKGLVHGVTCGAGMPYKLVDFASKYDVFYYPIVSSARAFSALWRRSYKQLPDLLGGVVYEDPWLAGGHNGLSNAEDPLRPENPFDRVAGLRTVMNDFGLEHVPVIMAGGVWHLSEWTEWIDSSQIGKIAFQFGTRPLLTQESPIPWHWKNKLLTLKKGDALLNKFSPTGFYSSAVKNSFIDDLSCRSERQIPFFLEEKNACIPIELGPRKRVVYIHELDKDKVDRWKREGFTVGLRTPDDTLVFTTPVSAKQIHEDQVGCMGCLSHCKFSNWKDHDDYTTGNKPDPRSFCIQKTLQNVVLEDSNIDAELMFSGSSGYRFATDALYAGGNIPSVRELVDSILDGK